MDTTRAASGPFAASSTPTIFSKPQDYPSAMIGQDQPTTNYQLTAAQNNKRKEKARIAARVRRSQEASIIMEMANELHITQEKMRRIDKTTIIKLAIDYIKAFDLMCREPIALAAAHAASTTTTAPPPPPQPQPIAPTRLQHHRDSDDDDHENNRNRKHHHNDQQAPTRLKLHSQKRPPLQLQTNQQQSSQQQRRAQQIQRLKQLETNYENKDDDDDDEQLADFASQQVDENDDDERENKARLRQQLIEPPSISTASIFEPKTIENANAHYLMIEGDANKGRAAFVLKPDAEIADEDDLTHLAPQAGDMSIPLDVEPLESIVLDDKTSSLFVASPVHLSSSYLMSPSRTAAPTATLNTPPPTAAPLSPPPFSPPAYSSSSMSSSSPPQLSPVYNYNQAADARHQQSPFHHNNRILINFHGRHDNYY